MYVQFYNHVPQATKIAYETDVGPGKESSIKMIIKESGKSFKIILTGGLAHLFKNSIKRKAVIKKDLTINGILKVAVNTK